MHMWVKGSVRDTDEEYLWELKVSEDANDEEFQEALTRIIKQHIRDSKEFMKMFTTDGTQI